MFDHIEFKVQDFEKSKDFYQHTLAPLGASLFFSTKSMAGFGTGKIRGADGKERTELLIEQGAPQKPPMHIAFRSPSREAVNKFYEEAIRLGAKDNGAPGLRVDAHKEYYSAFVLDPDGHNIEAVFHGSSK